MTNDDYINNVRVNTVHYYSILVSSAFPKLDFYVLRPDMTFWVWFGRWKFFYTKQCLIRARNLSSFCPHLIVSRNCDYDTCKSKHFSWKSCECCFKPSTFVWKKIHPSSLLLIGCFLHFSTQLLKIATPYVVHDYHLARVHVVVLGFELLA